MSDKIICEVKKGSKVKIAAKYFPVSLKKHHDKTGVVQKSVKKGGRLQHTVKLDSGETINVPETNTKAY